MYGLQGGVQGYALPCRKLDFSLRARAVQAHFPRSRGVQGRGLQSAVFPYEVKACAARQAEALHRAALPVGRQCRQQGHGLRVDAVIADLGKAFRHSGGRAIVAVDLKHRAALARVVVHQIREGRVGVEGAQVFFDLAPLPQPRPKQRDPRAAPTCVATAVGKAVFQCFARCGGKFRRSKGADLIARSQTIQVADMAVAGFGLAVLAAPFE